MVRVYNPSSWEAEHEDQEFKSSFSYTASLSPTWATWDPSLKQ